MVSRHAYTCSGRTSANLTSPSTAVSFPSSQRSFAIVTGSAWCISRYSSTSSASVIDAPRPSRTQPLDNLLKRLLCLSAARKPTDLRPRGAATLEPIPVCPKGLAVRALRLQLAHLTLLHHHEPPRSRTRPRNHTATSRRQW